MPSLLTVVHMDGLRHALNAFLDARDVARLWRTARSFRQLHVLHLRVGRSPIRGAAALGVGRNRCWRLRTLELIDDGLRTLELVGCDLHAEQLGDLCDAVRARGVLKKLVICSNVLCGDGSRVVAAALANNASLEELAVAGVGPGVKSVIQVVSTMGALKTLRLPQNKLCTAEAGDILGEMLESNRTLTALDVSQNYDYWAGASYGVGFAEGVAHGVQNNGAISNVNILSNDIGAEQANELIKIMESHDTLKTLCGFSGDATELDLSNKTLSAGCGVLIANEVKNIGALASLNLASNRIGAEGAQHIAAALPQCKALAKLNIRDNRLCAPGTKTLAEALQGNQIMTELNISGNGMGWDDWYDEGSDMSGVEALASAIPTMGALATITFGTKQAVTMTATMTEANFSGKLNGYEAHVVAAFLPKCRALVKLLMGANGFKGNEAGKALGDAIATNTVLKELDISGGEYERHRCDVEFVKEFSVGLGANGAMVKFDVSNNGIGFNGLKALAEALRDNKILTKLNVANNNVTNAMDGTGNTSMSGVSTLADAIPTMGALETLTFGGIQMVTMKTGMTDANFRGKHLRASGAIVLAAFLPKCRAMVKFDISENGLFASGGQAIAQALKGNKIIQELSIASNHLGYDSSFNSDMSAVLAISDAIPAMGALTSLNISQNSIGGYVTCSGIKAAPDGPKAIAEALKGNGALVKLDISRNSIKGEALQRITELCGTKGIELVNESESGSKSESGSGSESESDGYY